VRQSIETAAGVPAVASAPRPGAERRRAVRYACGYRTMLQPISLREIAPLPVQVRDISATGIGLLSRAPVPPCTFLFIELQSMLDGTARRLRARVIHATRQGNGSWLLGCVLTDELSAKELQGLL